MATIISELASNNTLHSFMSSPSEILIDKAKDIILNSQQLVAFSGAGLSAESGIATFRDHKTGALWDKYDPTQLASQEGFNQDRGLVIDWYNWRRKNIHAVAPNAAHQTLASTQTSINQGWTHVTQNVDNLLERAGLDADKVIHLHGTITRNHCNNDNCDFSEAVDLANPKALQLCPKCKQDYLRPSVVWFGEALPDQAWYQAQNACSNCDTLLVIGTSAQVYPAANLIPIAKQAGAKVIVVNTQSSGASNIANVELIGAAGEILPQLIE